MSTKARVPCCWPAGFFFQRKGMFKMAQRAFAFWLLGTQSGFSPSQQGAPWPLSPGAEWRCCHSASGRVAARYVLPIRQPRQQTPSQDPVGTAPHNCRREPGSKAQGASVCRGPARTVAGMLPARRLCPWEVDRVSHRTGDFRATPKRL